MQGMDETFGSTCHGAGRAMVRTSSCRPMSVSARSPLTVSPTHCVLTLYESWTSAGSFHIQLIADC